MDELLARECDTVEIDVQVSVRRRFDPRDAVNGSERGGDLLRDGARSLAQPPSELEGRGRSQVAELALGRILDRQLG